ncbi:MAG: gamma-glutamyltransferase [Ignavibacteriaceae bacterium]|nr:gamma-glutamyltransferase [Ignavibacteriaceae bacterium]
MRQKSSYSNKIFLLVLFFLIAGTIHSQPQKVCVASKAMVVSAEELATKVGVQILKKGGNAIDAAVAVGFALAVTYPTAGNIGGGGFLVAHLGDGRNISIDFRETAPKKSFRNMYLDSSGNFVQEKSLLGGLAVGVPGTVAGLILALEKYGSMSLTQVIQPAINLAEYGFPLSVSNAKMFNENRKYFQKFESSSKLFVKENEFKEGDIFYQKDLAKTLNNIQELGIKGFYEGEVAQKLVKCINQNGGIFQLEDLTAYKAIERDIIKGNFLDYEIISMPPPSSGGIALVQILNMMELIHEKNPNLDELEYYHSLIEVLKLVYAERAAHLGDPDFIDIPTEKLISKMYAKYQSNRITNQATPSKEIQSKLKDFFESEETTHYSVLDEFGNAVSVTYTLNSGFGSKLIAEGTGVLLNNEMDDFSAKPGVPNQFGLVGSEANSIEPHKRMLSSMTPTIVLKENKPYLIVGTPGGSTIITVVAQVILNKLLLKEDIETSVFKPRVHHQWLPDQIDIETDSISEELSSKLVERGHKIGRKRLLGLVEAILIEDGKIIGVSDKRGSGHAEGY